MKKIIVFAIVIVACYASYSFLTKQNNNDTALNDEVLQLVQLENKVYEALITEANVMYVSVDADGTKRDGYARYLCDLMLEKGGQVSTVKVIQVNTTKHPDKDNAYGVLLGNCDCK